MANTVTQRTVHGGADTLDVVRVINIVSDGTEEADLVIYDNSALIANVAAGRLMSVEASGSACTLALEWDATTDVPIVTLDPSASPKFCFEKFGGISNPGGTGATGDIVLTTTGLDAGDVVTLVFTVRQR